MGCSHCAVYATRRWPGWARPPRPLRHMAPPRASAWRRGRGNSAARCRRRHGFCPSWAPIPPTLSHGNAGLGAGQPFMACRPSAESSSLRWPVQGRSAKGSPKRLGSRWELAALAPRTRARPRKPRPRGEPCVPPEGPRLRQARAERGHLWRGRPRASALRRRRRSPSMPQRHGALLASKPRCRRSGRHAVPRGPGSAPRTCPRNTGNFGASSGEALPSVCDTPHTRLCTLQCG